MNRDDYLNSCAKYLGRLAHEIRALNATGRFDINSVTEDFLVPVLKVVFDCPELQNQNEIQQNFPSVDLGCKKSRTSFQVTTDASSSKVVKTLEKFREHHLEKSFDRLFVLTITEKQSSYTAKALTEAISALPVSFDATSDILDLHDILSRIRRLETTKLEFIEAYLASEFQKRDKHLRFREELSKFLEFSRSKIEFEKSSKKYIPSIFVETHTTKEEMRLFANPLFFYRRVNDLLSRLDYNSLNSLLSLAKELELDVEIPRDILTAAPSTFAQLESWVKQLDDAIERELEKVGPLSWRRREYEMEYQPRHGDSAGWSIVRIQVESIATALTDRLSKARSHLQLMRQKIFLITSMAGQGKTNFVCDLIENQFRSFELPCLFIPARELNAYPAHKRLLGYISNNRYAPAFSNVHEYLHLFNEVAAEHGKPFLLVIDGINEVTALDEFSDELRGFCGAVCQYDHVKIVITCRSEFFDDRYASLLQEPFSVSIHRVTDLRSQMSEGTKSRLLASYLRHFKVVGRLGGPAEDFLRNDLLLLRIFCERYEGRSIGYTTDIYKGDLFEDYLFGKVEAFPEKLRGKALPTLLKIVSEMLRSGDCSKLSVRSFSFDEQEVVRRLVAEDVILRQEVASKSLAELGEFVISFTYDELRDFVIAYKLVDSANAVNGVADLKNALSGLQGRPIFEGVYRYLYLLARKAKNFAAIEACESADGFIEHFTLNVHLLPPAVQNPEDVARARSILADLSVPTRARRVARFLLRRRNPSELLNASILIGHLNALNAEDHKRLVVEIFANPNDYGQHDWRHYIDSFVRDVDDNSKGAGIGNRPPLWLAFFLHASSLSSWMEREQASSLFRSSASEPNTREAIEMVRPAMTPAVQRLLEDIEEPVEISDVG